MSDDFPKTLSVPEAGKKYFDLSPNGSYNAAAAGLIPTIRIGRLLRVPVRALEKMLDNVGITTAPPPSLKRAKKAAKQEARPPP